MRLFHWIFVCTCTLFLSSVLMAQVSPRPPLLAPAVQVPAPVTPCSTPVPAADKAPPEGKPPLPGVLTPKATVKDIMNALVVPSSAIIFGAVATMADLTGEHEYKPETDDDWNIVFANAVMLTESANLLMVQGRQRCLGGVIPAANRAEWTQLAREFVEAADEALVAAQKHDATGISNAGERIDVACDTCHERFQLVVDPAWNAGKVLGNYNPPPAPRKR